MTKRPLSILDIGSGPGTAVMAAADLFGANKVHATCVDQNPHILKDAAAIAKNYAGLKIDTICTTISSRTIGRTFGDKKFDIIILMNFLNEIGDAKERENILGSLFMNHLEKNGAVIVIEPALQRQTRQLMELRDIAVGSGNIISPCLHNGPCPMLTHNRRDWCHMYLDWDRPKLMEKVDRLIGNRKEYLKFSYFILTHEPAKESADNVWRVVSSPLVSNGKIELLVCNQKGLIRLTRLDKDRSQSNWQFEELKRGEILIYDGPERIGKDAIIKRT